MAIAGSLKRGDSVFDIGANVGYYTLLACSLVGPEGRVFAFEPVPRNLSFLRRHLKLNHFTNCTILEAAVGKREGTAQFDVPSPFTGHLIDSAEGALSVKVVTLDGLVASGQLPPPTLIKIDIEGGEYDALVGAFNTLSIQRPTVFLATHSPEIHQECCKLLTSLGYQLSAIDGSPIDRASELRATHQA